MISPPFDIKPEDSLITITAVSDNGVEGKGFVQLNLVGPSSGLEPVNIDIKDIVRRSSDRNELTNVDAIIEFDVYNDSNFIMQIYSMEAANYPATFIIADEKIAPRSATKVKMSVDLPEGFDRETVTVALKVLSNEGTFVRNIEFNAKEAASPDTNVVEPTKPEGDGIISIGSGLFTLANARNMVIVLLLLTVIALIVYSVLKVTGKKEEPALETVQEHEPVKAEKQPEKPKAKKSFAGKKPKKAAKRK